MPNAAKTNDAPSPDKGAVPDLGAPPFGWMPKEQLQILLKALAREDRPKPKGDV